MRKVLSERVRRRRTTRTGRPRWGPPVTYTGDPQGGRGAEAVAAPRPRGVGTALRAEQLGTGHAAQVGLAALDPSCDAVVIANGDLPLMTGELVRALVDEHERAAGPATLLTARLNDP